MIGSDKNGSISYAIKKFLPSFRFEHEDRSIETPVTDSLDNASFGFTTLAPKFSFKGIYGMNLSSDLNSAMMMYVQRETAAPIAVDHSDIWVVSA